MMKHIGQSNTLPPEYFEIVKNKGIPKNIVIVD